MVQELKARIKRVVDEANKGNMDVLDELYATNFVRHMPPPTPDIEGLETVKQYAAGFRSAFPDFQETIDEIIVEGDIVVLRLTFRGTHKGEFMGIAPTGKQVTGRVCLVGHRVGGKTVEEWLYSDDLSMLQQLGVISPLEQG